MLLTAKADKIRTISQKTASLNLLYLKRSLDSEFSRLTVPRCFQLCAGKL